MLEQTLDIRTEKHRIDKFAEDGIHPIDTQKHGKQSLRIYEQGPDDGLTEG